MRAALLAVQAQTRLSVTGALSLAPDGTSWVIPVTLSLDPAVEPSEFVPRVTPWHVLIPIELPDGEIKIYPSKEGITATFPHQNRNDPGAAEMPWRTGKLCLDRATARLGSVASREPRGPEDRLTWHIHRALAWLDAAAEGQLLRPGEPFELPQTATDATVRLVHDESTHSFEKWREYLREWGKWGSLELELVPGASKTLIATEFYDQSGALIRQAMLQPTKAANWKGFWWIWPNPVVLPPWRAPTTWGELRSAGAHQGLNVDTVLRDITGRSQELEAPILLLGYPIPRIVGEDAEEIHWQALSIPGKGTNPRIPHGFRDNGIGRWQALRQKLLSDAEALPKLATQNWHPDRTQARGRVHGDLRGSSVALIGVGALGSALAELLARAGVSQVVLIDGDVLEVGNLVRHTLDVRHLGAKKAESVAERLRLAAPMARVEAIPRSLPSDPAAVEALLADADVVVDCTAENAVLTTLSRCWWPRPKLFVSASVGYRAQRTYIFSSLGSTFPADEFFNSVSSRLQHERALWAEEGETLEGAGCWSPLFPARLDDLWLAAVATMKRLEARWVDRSAGSELEVFEVQQGLDRFRGLAALDGSR